MEATPTTMTIVVAMGGNALLRRGQPMTAEVQRENIRVACQQLAPVAEQHRLVLSHGNGPQVGLLALQGHAYEAVEPYPLDASKVIRYIALEGPESGTYFRGGARTESGIAIIAVPDHFRMVSTEEGMTVHVTPVGQFTQIWVESVDLNNVVIRSSRDVEFHYIVHGIRRAFRDFNPITQGQEFMPQTPGDTLSPGLPTEIRERLITMGVYNPDGTVNMRTAERLGWDRVWEARAGGVATR